MNRYNRDEGWIIWLSFVIAIILQIMPCPLLIYLLCPSWLNLLFIYWVMVLPHRVNIGAGFLLGLIMDLIIGSTLGVHALTLSIIAYLTVLKFRLFLNITIFQQTIFVILLSIITKLIIYLIYFYMMNILFKPEIFLTSLVDGIIWPWLFLLMRKIRS